MPSRPLDYAGRKRHDARNLAFAEAEGDDAVEAEGVSGGGGHAFFERCDEPLVDRVDGLARGGMYSAGNDYLLRSRSVALLQEQRAER